jgi:hypothetical protein
MLTNYFVLVKSFFLYIKVQNLWKKSYLSNFRYVEPSDHENLFFKFKSDIMRIYSKRTEFASMKKSLEAIIDREVASIRSDPFQLDELKENDSTLAMNNVSMTKNAPLLPPRLKDKETIIQEFRRYTLSNLIRAHSKDGSSHDNLTQVNDIAFELQSVSSDLSVLPKYTNLFATCGQNIVNIIDANTGKVIKRYNDDTVVNRQKEVHFNYQI